MRFIISTIFAVALLGAIASADPKRGQQSNFRLERRHEHHHNKVDHSHHRKSSHKERRSLDDQWTVVMGSDTYDPIVEDTLEEPVIGPDVFGAAARIADETIEVIPHIGDRVIYDDNGQIIGVEHVQGQMAAEDADFEHHHRANHHHHKASQHRHLQKQSKKAQKHGKKVHRLIKHTQHKNRFHHSYDKKASSYKNKKSSSKKFENHAK